MSIDTAFSNSKTVLRRGAFALATVTAMTGATTGAQAAEFTREECGLIAETSRAVVKAVGVNTLSLEFRQSLGRFLVPDRNVGLTCAGPTQIATPTTNDVAAYSTILSFLPFDLQARGVRAVAQLSSATGPQLALQ